MKPLRIIEAALAWRKSYCDEEDIEQAKTECRCEVCELIRACDEYEEKVKYIFNQFCDLPDEGYSSTES